MATFTLTNATGFTSVGDNVRPDSSPIPLSGSIPGDFDPAGVTGIRVQYDAVVSGNTDDTIQGITYHSVWTDGGMVAARFSDPSLYALSNGTTSTDYSDFSLSTSTDWSNPRLAADSTSETGIFIRYTSEMKADDPTLTVNNVVVTVDYTPAVAQPPVASFTASATTITEGDVVTFDDTSTNNPTTLAWDVTPTTGTVPNPGFDSGFAQAQCQFNTAGSYSVTLTATNAAGSDVSDPTIITVNPPAPAGSGTGSVSTSFSLTGTGSGAVTPPAGSGTGSIATSFALSGTGSGAVTPIAASGTGSVATTFSLSGSGSGAVTPPAGSGTGALATTFSLSGTGSGGTPPAGGVTTEVTFDAGTNDAAMDAADYPDITAIAAGWTQRAGGIAEVGTTGFAPLYVQNLSENVLFLRVYFQRFTITTTGDAYIFTAFDNGDPVDEQGQCRARSGNEIQIRDSTTGIQTTSTAGAFSEGEWARIEVKYDATLGASGVQDFRAFYGANLEGTTPDVEYTGLSMGNNTSTIIGQFRLGTQIASGDQILRFRNLGWSTSNWLGPYVAPAAGFSPLDIAWDHALWADQPGFTPPANNAALTADPDNLGSNGTSWTRTTTPDDPVWITDIGGSGKPAFSFPNESRLASAVGTTMGNPRTFVAVARTLSTSNSDVFDSSTGRSLLDGVSDFWRIYAGSDVGYASPDTDLHLFVVTFNGASSSIEVDNVTVATGDAGSNTADTNVYVGSAPLGTMPHNGSEVAFFGALDGTLTTQEKDDLWTWYQAEYLGIGGPAGGGVLLGDTNVTAIKFGDTDVLRVYKGDTLIYGSPPGAAGPVTLGTYAESNDAPITVDVPATQVGEVSFVALLAPFGLGWNNVAGWSRTYENTISGEATLTLDVFYRAYQAGDPATQQFTTSSGSNGPTVAIPFKVTGLDTADLLEATLGVYEDSSFTVTATLPGQMLIVATGGRIYTYNDAPVWDFASMGLTEVGQYAHSAFGVETAGNLMVAYKVYSGADSETIDPALHVTGGSEYTSSPGLFNPI